MSELLRVENLQVEIKMRHRRLIALSDVSLSVSEGEILGVVGELGAGKSIMGTAILDSWNLPLIRLMARLFLQVRELIVSMKRQ